MTAHCPAHDSYQISPAFRAMIEDRIARLEQDARRDEAQVANLQDADHIRRHMHLVVAERAEALRMRLFLDRTRIRLSRSPASPLSI